MAMNNGFAFSEASSGGALQDSDTHALTGTNYEVVLGDLCGKIQCASYYSGSSSMWFLRGALEKHEEAARNRSFSSGNHAFSPRGLTDVLLEKLLLQDDSVDPLVMQQEKKEEDRNESHQESDKNYENYLTVAKALACDSSKYLPAIADSLSRLVSSAAITSTSLPSRRAYSSATTVSNYRSLVKRRKFAITEEFLQLWVNTIVDDSTPENLHDQLCGDLFRVIEQRHKLRYSNDLIDLPTYTLSCLSEGDCWHFIHHKGKTAKSKSLSPPSTQATLRRASVLFRFLSLVESGTSLDAEIAYRSISNSGAMEWFLEVLKGEGYPVRYKKQRYEISFGLLDLLLDEFKIANNLPTKTTASVEWLLSSNIVETMSLFCKETIRALVEEWDGHLRAMSHSKEGRFAMEPTPGTLKSRKNQDLVSGENRNAIYCSTRYIKFIARLPPKVCPFSSLTIVEEASRVCGLSGKDLLIVMLRRQESNLQRLRLVQLLIDEFGNSSISNYVEKDEDLIVSRRQWLSSTGILSPILEECSRDPFLASSDTTERFLSTYGDPSWKVGFSNKPMPREAPKAIPIEDLQAKRTQLAALSSTHSSSQLPSWLLSAKGEGKEKFLLMVRSKMGDRWFGSNQGNHYNLFAGGERSSGKPLEQQQQYNLFNGCNSKRDD